MRKVFLFVFIFSFITAEFAFSRLPDAGADINATDPRGPVAASTPVPVDPVPPTGGAAAEAGGEGAASGEEGQQGNQFRSCQDAQVNIPYQCSQTPGFLEAQAKRSFIKKFAEGFRSGGAKGSAEKAKEETTQSLATMGQVRQACQKAFSDCQNKCLEETKQVHDQWNSWAQGVQQPVAMAEYNAKVLPVKTRNENIQLACNNEYQKTMASTGAAMAEMGGVLESALGLIAALQSGKGGSSGTSPFEMASTDEDDICKAAGENAQYMPSCNGNGDPVGTRGGNLVSTGVGGLTSGTGAGDLMAASQGEPGGTSDPNKQDSGSGFNGFGSAGAGFGSGGGSGSSGSSGSSSGSDAGLNSDIHKGFLGASGASGGGGGFSGGSSSKPSPFAKFGGSSAGMQKAALNNKLNKFKNKQTATRAPASTGGANGPFTDNWSVVTKAYKKNSSTMFHGQK